MAACVWKKSGNVFQQVLKTFLNHQNSPASLEVTSIKRQRAPRASVVPFDILKI